VRLTNDPAGSFTSFNNARCIASNGNIVHVVWYDVRDGNDEIYYKRSTDGGTSWGADTLLTNNSAISDNPSVAVSGSVVHIVWHDGRNVNLEIYYKRSTDGGLTWGADTRLTNDPAYRGRPSVSVTGQVVHVVWGDLRHVNREVYYKRSTDGGTSWGADIRLTNNPGESRGSSVSVSGSLVNVVWFDNSDGNEEIYYKRSIDGGISWGADTRLTNNTAASQDPTVSVSDSSAAAGVHVVWHDNRDGNFEIYYKRSIDGGISWGADTRLTNNTAVSQNPSVSVSGLVVHVVWYDTRDGNSEIYYKRSTDGGSNWGVDTRLTNNPAASQFPFLSVSGQVVHVVWQDSRDGNFEIYYKRDPTGNVVGINSISNEIPKEFSLSQNYPNPFNPMTHLEIACPPARQGISKLGFVSLKVYDLLGKEVKTLVNENKPAGRYSVEFDGGDLSSGIYFYKLESGRFKQTKRMLLLK